MSEAAGFRLRMTAFRWGVLAGIAPVVLFAIVELSMNEPLYNVVVVTSGPDVSRHGGVRVIVENEHGPVADQACRDECDDLKVLARSVGDDAYSARVLDGAGTSLASGGDYVTSGIVTRIVVSGSDKLSVAVTDTTR